MEELKLIWQKRMIDRDFKCEERVAIAVMLNLGKINGTKQFGSLDGDLQNRACNQSQL